MTRLSLIPAVILGAIVIDGGIPINGGIPIYGRTAMARSNAGGGPMTAVHFAWKAAEGGMTEVALARLATEKAADPGVAELARRIHDDHSRTYDELSYLAARMGWSLPDAPGPAATGTIDRLSRLHGTEFDRQYVETVVKDHDRIVATYDRYTREGMNSDLRTWAASVLPDLREQGRLVRSAAIKIGLRVTESDSKSLRTARAGR